LRRADADSALLVSLEPGLYTAQVTAPKDTEGLCLIEAYDADALENESGKAVNISTRAEVGPGQEVLIAGFVIAGDAARRVLIRGVGPALRAQFGMEGGSPRRSSRSATRRETSCARLRGGRPRPTRRRFATRRRARGRLPSPMAARTRRW